MRPSVKYLAIYRHKNKYAISLMCKFFNVSRSGYYDFVKGMDKPSKNEHLIELIKECQEKTRRTYGYRRVKIWLERNYNIILNAKTVLKIMNHNNLLSQIRRRKKYKQMGKQLHKYENILNRDFTASKPNQKWVNDITKLILRLMIIRIEHFLRNRKCSITITYYFY